MPSRCQGILGRIFGHKFVHCSECMWAPGHCLRCGVKPVRYLQQEQVVKP